jgi:hypothetical protein
MATEELDDVQAFERGKQDCLEDWCNNTPFYSTGGIGTRQSMTAPQWVAREYADAYLDGYREAASTLYGTEWQTCSFEWHPAVRQAGHIVTDAKVTDE